MAYLQKGVRCLLAALVRAVKGRVWGNITIKVDFGSNVFFVLEPSSFVSRLSARFSMGLGLFAFQQAVEVVSKRCLLLKSQCITDIEMVQIL